MSEDDKASIRARWARLRFLIIGDLLAAPPTEHGELARRLEDLAKRTWKHPTTGEVLRVSVPTLERWYYLAKSDPDPVGALERKVPSNTGTHPAICDLLVPMIQEQYREHPRWSYQLHFDNLRVRVREDSKLGKMPSYPVLRRFMKERGLIKLRRRKGRRDNEPERVFEERERRSFEVSHVHALWHLDFHEGRRKVLTAGGEWKKPQLLGVLDDHSRLGCHLQWYLDEDTEALVHGLCQAIQKRGLPRGLLTDRGGAMLADETQEGLLRLGITHYPTLARTPEQNAKIECLWGPVEGRLMAMLEGEPELSLTVLNEATQAWLEGEYQRRRHSEIGESPLERALRGPSVVRPSPSSEELRRAFRMTITRMQRKSDGTVVVEGVRYEVPSRYRALSKLTLRVARWDLSVIELVDPKTGGHLALLLPLDKEANADRRRKTISTSRPANEPVKPSGIAPHLRALMAEYAATGLPPAYIPLDRTTQSRDEDPKKEENS